MTDFDDLRRLAPLVPRARQAMLDNLPGYSTGPGGPGSGHGDRTGELAIRFVMSRDDVIADLADLGRLCPDQSVRTLQARLARGENIRRDVDKLFRIVNVWVLSTRREENLRASADSKGAPGCRSCAKIGHWSDVFRSGLCAFCYRWLGIIREDWDWDDDVLPRRVVEWHHDTGKGNVTTKVLGELLRGLRRRDPVDA